MKKPTAVVYEDMFGGCTTILHHFTRNPRTPRSLAIWPGVKSGIKRAPRPPKAESCSLKCCKNVREHLPWVVGTGAEAAGVNMRCRHAADLAPRPFWGTRKAGRQEETRDRLVAQERPARRV